MKIIDLKFIKYYYLNHENNERKSHMEKLLKGKNYELIKPNLNIKDKILSGSSGHYNMILKGLSDQDLSKPFQPFIIMEDDLKLTESYEMFPEYLRIPNDSDLFYLGLTAQGWFWNEYKTDGFGHEQPIITSTEYEGIIRLYNMLSLHSVMICSPKAAMLYTRCLVENFYTYKHNFDTKVSTILPDLNTYGMCKPIFCQDSEVKGEELYTNIQIDSDKKRIKYHFKENKNYVDLVNRFGLHTTYTDSCINSKYDKSPFSS